MSKSTFIYSLKDSRSGEIFYIGKANNPKARLAGHIRDKKSNPKKTERITEILLSGGQIVLEILEQVEFILWEEREKFWIAKGWAMGWPLTNIEIGGTGKWRPNPEQDYEVIMRSYLSPNLLEKFLSFPDDIQDEVARLICLHASHYGFLATKVKRSIKDLENWFPFRQVHEAGMIANILVLSYGSKVFDEVKSRIIGKSETLIKSFDKYLSVTWGDRTSASV